MLNIIPFDEAVLEHFPIYINMQKFKPLGRGHIWPQGLHLNKL